MAINKSLEKEGKIEIKPMGLGHINEIVEIEELVFPTPWSKQSFIYELVHNDFAYYLVVLIDDVLAGYGGMWLVLDEAHITNVAVHPNFQGRKIGELLLGKIVELAERLGAERMTLEVRVSNSKAQRLYEKQGFKARGLRKGYYTDTKEDAIIMWLEGMQNKRRLE